MNSPTTQQDLETFITNGVEERLDVEYKRADSLKKSDGAKREITKDVSSFANSAGGIIIYGIAEFDEPEKAHLPERIDPVDRTVITREWLDQVIGNIRPRLDVTINTHRFGYRGESLRVRGENPERCDCTPGG